MESADYSRMHAVVLRARALAGDARARAELEARQPAAKPAPVVTAAPPPPARASRCRSWVRPQGSTLYPSAEDAERERLGNYARGYYRERG